MNKRAFTIFELLTSIAIIGVLVSILVPVLRGTRRSGQITSSINNLHQFHTALKLYQSEDDGEGKYGSPEEMGFPSQEYITFKRFGTPEHMWQSPCGQNFKWHAKPIVIQYEFYPYQVVQPRETEIARKYTENLLTFRDMNCSDDFEDLTNPLLSHRGLGVLLSGQLVNVRRPGYVNDPSWWSQPINQ